MQAFLEGAGLTGRKLAIAVTVLADNMIDTVDELRILSQTEEYRDVLPIGGIRMLVTKALANSDLTTKAGELKPERSEQDTKVTTKSSSLALPEGKTFAYFASHVVCFY